jgi:nucleotide-binding universal stress UspA family protein
MDEFELAATSRAHTDPAQDTAPQRQRAEGDAAVLVGLDGREHDQDALALATKLQAALGGQLILAHAIPPPAVGELEAQYAPQARKRGHQLLASAQEQTGAVARTCLVETWPAAYSLRQLADDYRAGMLVLASSHRGPVGRIVPGSTASHLLAHPPCAIGIAPRGYAHVTSKTISTIGVAYDVTPEADQALAAAAKAADTFGARLRLYHATHAIPDAPAWNEYRQCTYEFAQGILDAGLRQVPTNVAATSRLLEGAPADVLADAAREDGIDLLYVGSRGYGPIREALFGGVAGGLIQTSSCPLVIIPSGRSAQR